MGRRMRGGAILFLMSLGVFAVLEVLAEAFSPALSVSRAGAFAFSAGYAVLSVITGRGLPGWCPKESRGDAP